MTAKYLLTYLICLVPEILLGIISINVPDSVKLFQNPSKIILKFFYYWKWLSICRQREPENYQMQNVNDSQLQQALLVTLSGWYCESGKWKVFYGQSIWVLRLIYQQLIPIHHAHWWVTWHYCPFSDFCSVEKRRGKRYQWIFIPVEQRCIYLLLWWNSHTYLVQR